MSLCVFIYRYFKGTYRFKVQQVCPVVRPDLVSTGANGDHSISFKGFPCCIIELPCRGQLPNVTQLVWYTLRWVVMKNTSALAVRIYCGCRGQTSTKNDEVCSALSE